ncbi:hypothetical protein OG758_31320 [Streptomyces sp. NBC_01474]|uniref:hypothetical protein n=2 Tax=Streptomyces TaxID=1883 RepID=UPI002DD9AAA5|nr:MULTISPECIES: hypothetical protein [unclassified Streptomyces]WSD98251.1 hypothetical protein OG758_31320 [Streptomyces sp. NBC_01474]
MEHEDRALMPALTGEPLPQEDAADPEVVAAYAAAQADVALLAEQVRGIGDVLAARAGPGPAPLVALRPRRRPLAVAFGALAAACAAAMLGGLAWLGVAGAPGDGADSKSAADHRGAADSGKQGADVTPEGFVACSRLIVEGTVVRVEPVPGAERDTITLTATRYYKPAKGPEKVTFRMDHDVDPRLKPGDRTLISIPKGEEYPDNWATKAVDRASLRDMVVNALPGSRALKCSKAPGPGA